MRRIRVASSDAAAVVCHPILFNTASFLLLRWFDPIGVISDYRPTWSAPRGQLYGVVMVVALCWRQRVMRRLRLRHGDRLGA